MSDQLDAFALELRATAPAAPARLRARVDEIAARTPPAPASWRTWFQPRRALLVAAPTAVAVMLVVAVAHGLSSSPVRSDAARPELTRGLGVPRAAHDSAGTSGALKSADRATAPFSVGKAIAGATPRAANGAPPLSSVRAQEYRAMLTVRLGSVDGMSDAMKKAIRATRAW